MGLFGGFKAKFSGRVKNKSNNSKKETTVECLSYKSFSEFDIPANVQYRVSLTRNEPLTENQVKLKPPAREVEEQQPPEESPKGVKSILKTKSAYESDNDDTHNKNVFENKVSKSNENKVRDSDEDQVLYTFKSEIEDAPSSYPMTESLKDSQEKDTRRNTILDVSYFTHQQEYSSDEESDHESIQEQILEEVNLHENSITETFYGNPENITETFYGNPENITETFYGNPENITETFYGNSENITETFYGNPENTTDTFYENPENITETFYGNPENITDTFYGNTENTSDVLYGNPDGQRTENFYFDTSEDYNENSFQVHHRTQYDMNSLNSYQNSEDNLSENHSLDFNAMGYSSQAASIFFGGDDSIAPKPRARKIVTHEEPDSRRGSMSA